MDMVFVKILRPVMIDGARVEPGQVIQLGKHLARMLISANKAIETTEPQPAPPEPPKPTTRTATRST